MHSKYTVVIVIIGEESGCFGLRAADFDRLFSTTHPDCFWFVLCLILFIGFLYFLLSHFWILDLLHLDFGFMLIKLTFSLVTCLPVCLCLSPLCSTVTGAVD